MADDKRDFWKYAVYGVALIVIMGAFISFSRDQGAPTGVVVEDGEFKIGVDDDDFLGPADAEIVVIEFSDFECTYCGAAAGTNDQLISRFREQDPSWTAAVPELKRLAEEGKIKFVFRDYPLGSHRMAQKASEAAECAGEQGKFWEYHDILFENQKDLDVNSLKGYAQRIGLDVGEFNKCLDSGEMVGEVRDDMREGQAAGVRGTPAFFIVKDGDAELISGAQSFNEFKSKLGL